MARFPILSALLLAGTALAGAAPATAQTVTVTMTDDVTDFGGQQRVADLPGPDGMVSFREACLAVNNTPGPQTIAFAIPNAPPHEWSGGVAMLYMDFSVFVLSDDETTVDFTTQTAFTGNTNPNGNEVGIRLIIIAAGSPAIIVAGDRCLIKGLDRVSYAGEAISISGNDNRVQGCTIYGPLFSGVTINGDFNGAPASRNVIGGTGAGEGNVLSSGNSGVRIDGPARDNVVIGNTLSGSYWGAEVRSPTCCPGNDAVDNRIGGPTAAERNVIRGAGKRSSEGFPVGGQVAIQYSLGTVVENNFVGVEADGRTVPGLQRGPVGVEIRSSPGSVVRDNVVGGIIAVGSNHYSGQRFGIGIHLMGDCAGTVVQGNLVGVDSTASSAVPNRAGITASYWSVNGMPVVPGPMLIGGDIAGTENLVANSELTGVLIDSRFNGVTLTRNSIYANGGLGIDLESGNGFGGVTLNDPGDGDSGANGLQNFPELISAVNAGGSTTIVGSLDSLPGSNYTLEFFASPDCDPSGHGEGERFLGSATVTTNAAGMASFSTVLAPGAASEAWLSATATSVSSGDTSEFAACIRVQEGLLLSVDPLFRGQPASLEVTLASAGERVFFLYSLNGTGAGSCPARLGGLCLDLLDPVVILGEASADAGGRATLNVQVPAAAPLIEVHAQAVVARGPGGSDSLKSNPVSSTIQP